MAVGARRPPAAARSPRCSVVFAASARAAAASGRDLADHIAGPFFWLLLAGYTLGAHTEGRRLWAGVVFAAAAVTLSTAVDALRRRLTSYVSSVAPDRVGPILFGQALRNRARLNQALHAKAERAERERAAAAEAAALEERTRIAGELHDVVAHALSAMTVQAVGRAADGRARPGSAPRARSRPSRRPGARRSPSCAACSACCAARTRSSALAPQPSLAHISSLVQRARAAGLPVDLRVDGEPRPAPGRRRPDRLPADPGGAAAGARGRRRGPRRASASTTAPARSASRSPTTAPPAAGGCSACASGSRSTAAS